jgi:hypothetical protein
MKSKNLFKSAILVSATAVLFSCGQSGNNQTNNSAESEAAKGIVVKQIRLDTATCFINRFKNENEYLIPSGWLFEKGIKSMMGNISDLKGIRFYAAINKNVDLNKDTLTLVMVPVVNNAIGNKIDYIDETYFYEFSDLCPPSCSEVTYVQVEEMTDNKNIIVGNSWYFSIDKFEKMFADHNVEGVRLYRFVKNNILNLRAVPVTKKNDTTYNDIELGYDVIADEICSGTNNCDTTSPLYNVTNCPN